MHGENEVYHWLHIVEQYGLFTGARVRRTCRMNPDAIETSGQRSLCA